MRVLALAGLLLLGGCDMLGLGGAREAVVIDGSSPEAFKRTVAEARSELGPRDRVKFEAAVTAVRGRQFAAAVDRQEYERRVRTALDGQTAPQIVAGVDSWTNRAGSDAADAVFEAKRELQKAAPKTQ